MAYSICVKYVELDNSLDKSVTYGYRLCPIQGNGRTPLMEVVRNNMVDMVKVLMYATDDRVVWETKETTDVDLSLQDIDGKSVIHHCVQNRKVTANGDLEELLL